MYAPRDVLSLAWLALVLRIASVRCCSSIDGNTVDQWWSVGKECLDSLLQIVAITPRYIW